MIVHFVGKDTASILSALAIAWLFILPAVSSIVAFLVTVASEYFLDGKGVFNCPCYNTTSAMKVRESDFPRFIQEVNFGLARLFLPGRDVIGSLHNVQYGSIIISLAFIFLVQVMQWYFAISLVPVNMFLSLSAIVSHCGSHFSVCAQQMIASNCLRQWI